MDTGTLPTQRSMELAREAWRDINSGTRLDPVVYIARSIDAAVLPAQRYARSLIMGRREAEVSRYIVTPAHVVEATGCGMVAAYARLARLLRRGMIERLSPGRFVRTHADATQWRRWGSKIADLFGVTDAA